MFFDKFKSLCDENNVSPKRAVTEIGLSNSIATKWKKTGATPSTDTLIKIANYFGIAVEDLLPDSVNIPCRTEPNEQKPAPVAGDELSEEELQFILWYRTQASDKEKALLRTLARGE